MFTMLPDLESLRCFEAVVTHGTFRKAATSLALSPSALSQRIASLERSLGQDLFSRTTRRVVLTPAGATALPLARKLLESGYAFGQTLQDPGDPIPYELTIGTRFELGLSWLTPSLSRLSKQKPERTIHLSFSDGRDMSSDIISGRVDAGITSSRVIPAGLRYEILHEEEYVFVASSASAQTKRLTRPGQAARHVLLDISPDLPLFRYFLDGYGEGGEWAFGGFEYLGTIGAIRLRVLEGAGVAVLPRYFVEPELKKKRLRQLLKPVRLKRDAFRLLWSTDHPREQELRQLASELRQIPLR